MNFVILQNLQFYRFCSTKMIQLKYLPHFNCNKVCWWSKFSRCSSTMAFRSSKTPKNRFKEPGTKPKTQIFISALSSCRMSQMKHCAIFYQNLARQTFKNTDFTFLTPSSSEALQFWKSAKKINWHNYKTVWRCDFKLEWLRGNRIENIISSFRRDLK